MFIVIFWEEALTRPFFKKLTQTLLVTTEPFNSVSIRNYRKSYLWQGQKKKKKKEEKLIAVENSPMLLARKHCRTMISLLISIQVTGNECHMTPSQVILKLIVNKNQKVNANMCFLLEPNSYI